MTVFRDIGLAFVLLFLFILESNSQALAQGVQPPPRYNDASPTGVTYREGSFTLSETDLSVGGGLPSGLSLTRSYNSTASTIHDPYISAVGWTQSLNMYINMQTVPYVPQPPEILEYVPPSDFDRCIVNVTSGSKSYGFHNSTYPPPPVPGNNMFLGGLWQRNWSYTDWLQQLGCGFPIGTYIAVGNHNAKLEFIESPSPGRYKLISPDGGIFNFAYSSTQRITDSTMPDGTRLDFTYSTTDGHLMSVFSNRGWAILLESQFKVCAVNTALTYVTSTSACPADVQTVTYGYSTGAAGTNKRLSTVTKGGEITNYQYDALDHLTCVKAPGQTVCRIQNTYTNCPPPSSTQPNGWANSYVTSQTDASGRIFSYTYDLNGCPNSTSWTDPDMRPFSLASTTVTETGVPGQTVIVTSPSKQVETITDPLGRVTNYSYEQTTLGDYGEDGELALIQRAEGNVESFTRDSRGNVTDRILTAKPGSGLGSLITHANYPADCVNIFTCNKPESIVDSKGATTNFTYDATHGGILTETAPADANGIRAMKRNAYALRAASLKNSAGTWTASNYPVWLLSETRTCRTTATIGGPGTWACAGGAADEVVTTYDYGSDVGPNNLLLRGMAVTSTDGGASTTLRTCYGYDRDGHKISETAPNANLTSCP